MSVATNFGSSGVAGNPQLSNASPGPVASTSAGGDLHGAFSVVEKLRHRLRAMVRGRDQTIELVIVALLSDGHVLLEDYPGSGKTTLAKALGESIVGDAHVQGASDSVQIASFRRIQFTPDLLPSDVTGTSIFDVNTAQFMFRQGPIFAHVVLADEINRTSPKVQAAMLEAMAEKQVTVDNRTRALHELFFVIATQNPLDLAGTFPLPAAQLDRFLFKIRMHHVAREAELEVLASVRERRAPPTDLPTVTAHEVVAARRAIENLVHVAPEVRETLVDIAGATRRDPRVLQGASTRSLVLMVPALQAHALAAHRDYVTADDVHALSWVVFPHRVEVAPGVEDPQVVLGDCIKGPLERLAQVTMRR